MKKFLVEFVQDMYILLGIATIIVIYLVFG